MSVSFKSVASISTVRANTGRYLRVQGHSEIYIYIFQTSHGDRVRKIMIILSIGTVNHVPVEGQIFKDT